MKAAINYISILTSKLSHIEETDVGKDDEGFEKLLDEIRKKVLSHKDNFYVVIVWNNSVTHFMLPIDKPFTIYYIGGRKEMIQGRDIGKALRHYGIRPEIIDFWINGDDSSYDWDKSKKEWVKKEGS
jgi:hypothetical protein